MHKIKDILRTISRQMQLSPDLLTVSSPMGANTASHEEQHYLWASVSSRVLNVMVFKEFKGKILLLRTFKDRVNFLRNFRMSGRPDNGINSGKQK